MKQKTILQICNFSSGISGTWTRALEDAREFTKQGYNVHIFSSDEEEDGQKTPAKHAILEYDGKGIVITRFPIKKRRGYALWFDFEDEAHKLKPDIIICHGLRKPYLEPAIRVAKQVGAKCFLITHAPFIDKKLRSRTLNFIIWLYDTFYGEDIMNSFDKVIAICKWEKEELLKLGCDEDRIEYIPNSLSDEFFTQKKVKEQKKILFLGRMHHVKELEVLIRAFYKFKAQYRADYVLEIVSTKFGPYYEKLREMAKALEIPVNFAEPIYDLKEKIKKIDEAEIFVLPSRKESLPFGLIEAMSRGKIVISTRTKGGKELIKDMDNGFLFDVSDDVMLSIILEDIIKEKDDKYRNKVRKNAKEKAKEFKVSNNMKKWEELFVK